jgi:hypothetical protein
MFNLSKILKNTKKIDINKIDFVISSTHFDKWYNEPQSRLVYDKAIQCTFSHMITDTGSSTKGSDGSPDQCYFFSYFCFFLLANNHFSLWKKNHICDNIMRSCLRTCPTAYEKSPYL